MPVPGARMPSLGQGYLPASNKLPHVVGVGVNVQLGGKAAGFIACAVC